MCGDVATPNLYVVAQQNCLQAPDTKTTVMGRRSGSSSSNDDVERAALWGLCLCYRSQGALRKTREIGEQLVQLAQGEADPTYLQAAHEALGATLCWMGDYAAARWHLEQGSALPDPTAARGQVSRLGVSPAVRCLAQVAFVLWRLGYPEQAVRRSQEALALAQTLAHPYSLANAQHWAAWLAYHRREVRGVQAQADALLRLATTQGFPLFVECGT